VLGAETDKFWTSGSDLGLEGQWIWDSTGEPMVYSYWDNGEPNNNHGNEHNCKIMGLDMNHHWNDNAGKDEERYICEQPAQRK